MTETENTSGWGWDLEDEEAKEVASPAKKSDTGCPPSPLKPGHRNGSMSTHSSSGTLDSAKLEGIKSSSSFLELERAIGATLAMNLSDSDLSDNDINEHVKLINDVISQKVNQHRIQRRPSGGNVALKSEAVKGIEPQQLSAVSVTELPKEDTKIKYVTMLQSDLKYFLDEPDSRALVLFHSPHINTFDIRNACLTYGVLHYFRSEYHSQGVTFVAFSDLRSAIEAQKSLSVKLGHPDVHVFYSVLLQSNNYDESKLHIAGVVPTKLESEIQQIFAHFGPLRSIQKIFSDNKDSTTCSYNIEYYSIQDAKIAYHQLLTTNTVERLGSHVVVTHAAIERHAQVLHKRLVDALSAHERTREQQKYEPKPAVVPPANEMPLQYQVPIPPPQYGGYPMQYIPPNISPYVIYPPHTEGREFEGAAWNHEQYPPGYGTTLPPLPYAPMYNPKDRPVHHTYRKNDQPSDGEYSIQCDVIESGYDRRTTLMIRNIPNKYTQQMLLEEINMNHEGTYDFFYLPIDFKNRCNVGYAFINFIEPQTITSFVREFSKQRWRNFNSEKVCMLTYARIQGKAAMIARFQNSSLLEKDDAYKPLLFVSKGEYKGQPEAFPSARKRY